MINLQTLQELKEILDYELEYVSTASEELLSTIKETYTKGELSEYMLKEKLITKKNSLRASIVKTIVDINYNQVENIQHPGKYSLHELEEAVDGYVIQYYNEWKEINSEFKGLF